MMAYAKENTFKIIVTINKKFRLLLRKQNAKR